MHDFNKTFIKTFIKTKLKTKNENAIKTKRKPPPPPRCQVRGSQQQCGTLQLSGADARMRL